MKKVVRNILIMMLIGMHLASCASDEVLTDNAQPIRMVVNCQPLTRGTHGVASQATTFDDGAKIRVYIKSSDNSLIISNGDLYTAVTPAGGKNTLNPPDVMRPPYFPVDDSKTIDIKAYYPSTITSSTTSFTVQTDQTTQSKDKTKDTYWAQSLNGSVQTCNLTFTRNATVYALLVGAGGGCDGTNGTFGYGGNYAGSDKNYTGSTTTNAYSIYLSAGMGGGGWYGGGSGGSDPTNENPDRTVTSGDKTISAPIFSRQGAGGGGSSYIWSSVDKYNGETYASKWPSNVTQPATKFQMTLVGFIEGARSCNGEARITYMGED